MKKLIFRKFNQDILVFFTTSIVIMGLIVWTIQAVNYFDYVTQDGHGLKIYFLYTFLNFPKIVNRILPFIFFVTLFYTILSYETKNELSIFWMNGISKIKFTNNIIFLSIFLMIFQIYLGGFLSPSSQLKARNYLKDSNVDYFTSIIKEGKFINAVKGLTIFIEKKNTDGSFSNIFLDDSTKNNSKMIYAKNGLLIDKNKKKTFKLFNGKVINQEKQKINVFEFDQIDFNLADFTANTITVPKVQEINSTKLLKCFSIQEDLFAEFTCNKSIIKEVKQELLKRFYKPIYIPVITILCCFLIITSKNKINYSRNYKLIFILTFFILVFSESSLRYLSTSNFSLIVYFVIPWIIFIIFYTIFYRTVKNV